MKVPYLDLGRQNIGLAKNFSDDLLDAVQHSEFILGKSVEQFENDFSEFIGSSYTVGVANGTDAIELAIRSLKLNTDDEVLVPTNSFIASALGVSRAGSVPVLCDSDENFHLDLDSAKRMLSSKTRALVSVSLYGQLPDMEKVKNFAQENNLLIIEDFAQSQGATYLGQQAGTFGDLGCTSFYPGKNLGALGDGGAVTTQKQELYEQVLALRNYGSTKKYHHPEIGFNSRLDSIQARFLSAKLQKLNDWNAERRELAAFYLSELAGIPNLELPKVVQGSSPVWHIFAILTSKRDELREHLELRGIGTIIHYPVPIHLQGAYAKGRVDKSITNATRQSERLVSLPLFPGMSKLEIEYVVTCVREFFHK